MIQWSKCQKSDRQGFFMCQDQNSSVSSKMVFLQKSNQWPEFWQSQPKMVISNVMESKSSLFEVILQISYTSQANIKHYKSSKIGIETNDLWQDFNI